MGQPSYCLSLSIHFAKVCIGDMQRIGSLHYWNLTDLPTHPSCQQSPQTVHLGQAPDSGMMAIASCITFACSTCFHQLLALINIFHRSTDLGLLSRWLLWHLNNSFNWIYSTSPIVHLDNQPADKILYRIEAQLLIQCCIILTLPVNYTVELPVKQQQSL